MIYNEWNIFMKYLWNAVDKHVFQELLEKAIGHELHPNYVDEKWNTFQTCPARFVIGFKEFFEVVIDRIQQEDYQG